MMELPAEFQHVKQNQIVDDGCLLFIPSKTVSQQVVVWMFLWTHFLARMQAKIHSSAWQLWNISSTSSTRFTARWVKVKDVMSVRSERTGK
jgi:hypothetical protein